MNSEEYEDEQENYYDDVGYLTEGEQIEYERMMDNQGRLGLVGPRQGSSDDEGQMDEEGVTGMPGEGCVYYEQEEPEIDVQAIIQDIETTIEVEYKDGKLILHEQDDSERNRTSTIDDIEKFIYEGTVDVFLYVQTMDYTYALYLLRKLEKVLSTYLLHNKKSNMLDSRILLDNNIAFLYMRMGLSDVAAQKIQNCLQYIQEERSKESEQVKGLQIRPDFFESRCEKMKYKKIKVRLNLALCILYSEKLEHEKALEYANVALNKIISLLYDTYLFSYHLILRKEKEERSDTQSTSATPKNGSQLTPATGQPDPEKVDVKYLDTLIAIMENILARVSEMGLERKDKEQTIALMKKLVTQTKQRFNQRRKNKAEETETSQDGRTYGGICVKEEKEIDLKYLYEDFFDDHWLNTSTILGVAQLQFLTPDDVFFCKTDIYGEVCPEMTVERISMLAICFYAISTEYRFKEKLDELKDKPDKKTLVQKETTVIAPRFTGIDINKKLEEGEASRTAKRSQKINEIKFHVPPSESYLGRAVEIAYLYLNHTIPFVLQIFNVFKRFQSSTPPEDEMMREQCLYLKSLKNGFISNIIIPVVRREPPKRPMLVKTPTMDEKVQRGQSIGKKREVSENRRLTSVPKQTLTGFRGSEHNSLTRKQQQAKEPVSSKQFDFAKTASEGFGFRKRQNGVSSAENQSILSKTGELKKPPRQTKTSKEEASKATIYRIKKTGFDQTRKEKRKAGEIQDKDFTDQLAVTSTSIKKPSNPPSNNIDIHIKNMNTYNIYLNGEASPHVLNGVGLNIGDSSLPVQEIGTNTDFESVRKPRGGRLSQVQRQEPKRNNFMSAGSQIDASKRTVNQASTFKIGKNRNTPGTMKKDRFKDDNDSSHNHFPPANQNILQKYKMYQRPPPIKERRKPPQTLNQLRQGSPLELKGRQTLPDDFRG